MGVLRNAERVGSSIPNLSLHLLDSYEVVIGDSSSPYNINVARDFYTVNFLRLVPDSDSVLM